MPNQRDGIVRFSLFQKTPTLPLIKRKGGPPSSKTLPANECKALFWHKWLGSSPMTFAIFGHAVFMSVATSNPLLIWSLLTAHAPGNAAKAKKRCSQNGKRCFWTCYQPSQTFMVQS
jgi:hypothetical protein